MFGAIRYTKTEVNTSDPWDSSKAVAAIPNDAKAESLRQVFAWVDADGDPDQRNAYKFAHHFVGDDGNPGAASVKACQAAIAYLNTQGKDSGLSDQDIRTVYNHLAAHLKDAEAEVPQLNSVSTEGTHTGKFSIDANSFEDDGQGTITFPGGQVLMDDRELRSGYAYDIESMDVSEFNGSVTEDHDRAIRSIVAKTTAYKRGNQILMDSLQFAINENPAAQIDYDLYRNGYAKDFSIETYGPWPDENNKFMRAKMVGLSCVVVGNSKASTMNSEMKTIIANSLATAKKNGLDTADVEQKLGVKATEPIETNSHKEKDMTYKTIKNGQTFAVKVTYKNAAGEDASIELQPGTSVDVAEDQAEGAENQIKQATNPADAPITANDLTTALNAALDARDKKVDERLSGFEKALLDNSARAPQFKPVEKSTRNASGKLEDMDWKERTALQVQSLAASFKGNRDAAERVWAINAHNLEDLQKEGLVSNALDLPDLGNFVIPKEMIAEIKEQVSNYSPLLTLFKFDETLSLDTAWLKGTGEVSMSDVEMNDNGDNTDLKPISKPTFSTDQTSLKEFAAVTPIKQSAIRFAAVDLVQHLTKLYRRAYDRALAESIIGRLEKAVESNGNTVPYNFSSAAGGNVEALITLITAWADVAEFSPNGVYLMTQKSYAHLFAMALRSGINGPLSTLFTTGPNAVPLFLGRPYAIVPSTLMPSLNTAATKSWTFEGTSVTVNSGVFFADPADFVGKVSGGLNFQVSDVAAYEENSTVKSSFQRDELVFRGYGYRASGLYFAENVSAVTAPGIS